MEILESFLDHTQKHVEKITEGLTYDDTEIVWRKAHAIKSGAAALTADQLSNVALELEKMG